MKNLPCCQKGSPLGLDFQEVNDFLKIINEPNRLKIMCFLKEEERCVCDIWKALEMPQNLTSHHLRTLKEFGLLNSKQEGRNIIYESNKKAIQKYTFLLNTFLISNL